MYPLFLDLTGRRVLVVGGGPVALRRARGLLAEGARVTVVAPDVRPEFSELPGIEVVRRAFRPGDVAGAWLVQACAGPAVDAEVVRCCQAGGTWCVQASDAEASPAWTGTSVAAPDGLQVSVSAGGDPGRALAARTVVQASLAGTDLRRRRPGTGRVIILGAGPGEPDLLTLRGAAALAEADVMVADRLAPQALVDGFGGEVIHVGKSPGEHTVGQDRINEILVEQAGAGHVVVRLKGGDPFVLGRGGEEVQACRAAGLQVEVIPGITSAVAVPAAAGIPVTHRGLASGFLVATAHGEGEAFIEHLAGIPPEVTLVLLMGVRQLRPLVDTLLGAGRDPATPAAVVERGWTPRQRTVRAGLAELPAAAEAAGVQAPSTVVIGGVAALHEELGDLARLSDAAGLVADGG